MEMLKAQNWMPWKRQMLAVLRDLGLEKYIAVKETYGADVGCTEDGRNGNIVRTQM